MNMNTLPAIDLADRFEKAAEMQKKSERNKVFMEITYPMTNDAVRSLRELSAIVIKAQEILGDSNPEFTQMILDATTKNILKQPDDPERHCELRTCCVACCHRVPLALPQSATCRASTRWTTVGRWTRGATLRSAGTPLFGVVVRGSPNARRPA